MKDNKSMLTHFLLELQLRGLSGSSGPSQFTTSWSSSGRISTRFNRGAVSMSPLAGLAYFVVDAAAIFFAVFGVGGGFVCF